MDQKEIEEKLKNFQVKHIEKPEKKVPAPRTSGSRERFRTISVHIAAHRCVAIPLTRILISKKDICLSGWHIPDG